MQALSVRRRPSLLLAIAMFILCLTYEVPEDTMPDAVGYAPLRLAIWIIQST